jgi:hypothetical protein
MGVQASTLCTVEVSIYYVVNTYRNAIYIYVYLVACVYSSGNTVWPVTIQEVIYLHGRRIMLSNYTIGI